MRMKGKLVQRVLYVMLLFLFMSPTLVFAGENTMYENYSGVKNQESSSNEEASKDINTDSVQKRTEHPKSGNVFSRLKTKAKNNRLVTLFLIFISIESVLIFRIAWKGKRNM